MNAAVCLFNFFFFAFCSSASEQAWAIAPDVHPAGLHAPDVVQVKPESLTAAAATNPFGATSVDAGSRSIAVTSFSYSLDADNCKEIDVEKDKPVMPQTPTVGGQVNEGFDNADSFDLKPISEGNGGVYDTRL